MAKDSSPKEEKNMSCCKPEKGRGGCAGGGVIYGLGLIGAAIYFIQHANSFGSGILGILKAIIWPALLVYNAFELLKF